MERALLQGEREAERALLQKEQKAVDQLQEKLMTLETSIQKERDKVTHNLAQLCWEPAAWERRRSALHPLPHHPSHRGRGPCPRWKVPTWRVLPGSGLVSGVSSAWVSVLPLGAWAPAVLGPPCPFLEVSKPLLGW